MEDEHEEMYNNSTMVHWLQTQMNLIDYQLSKRSFQCSQISAIN